MHQATERPPEPQSRTENPQNSGMNIIHLLAAGDPDNPIPPFTEEIMAARISRKFKLPTIKAYDGTGGCQSCTDVYECFAVATVTEAIMCRAFSQTLSGMAQHWYIRLLPKSISSFMDLNRAFIG